MTTVEAFAPAKINLTLHVTGQRPDGYHLLDSLVVFADIGDRVTLSPGPDLSLEVAGPFAANVPADRRNLVWRAAEAAGWTGRIRLEKNLPHGAGLGGGSADAAALLRSLFGDDLRSGIGADAALALGADVPVCLHAGPQRLRGIGERLSRISPVPALDLVLVHPGAHVATPDVFRALVRQDNPPMRGCAGWSERSVFLRWLAEQRNDLYQPACAIAPEIEAARDALWGAELTRMSGSGAACFGIYESGGAAQAAATVIARRHPGWWVVAARTAGAMPAQASRATT